MKQNLWRVRKVLQSPFYLRSRHTPQQPVAEHAQCMLIPLDSVSEPFVASASLPTPLRLKFQAPLFSETVLSVLALYKHKVKTYLSFRRDFIYSFTISILEGNCQNVLCPSDLRVTKYECRSRTTWGYVTPGSAVDASELSTIFHTLPPKCNSYKLQKKTSFVHYYSFFHHTGRGRSKSEVSFTGCATLLCCQQKLKLASENKGVTSAT